MKRILLSALAFVPVMAFSQVNIFTENFDTYNDGDYAGEVSMYMSTWSGTVGAGSSDDILVTNTESSSPSNSVTVTGPQAGGAQDGMVVFPSNYTSGNFHYSMDIGIFNRMVLYQVLLGLLKFILLPTEQVPQQLEVKL